MLKYFALIGLTFSVSLSIAQTNVFPANGNVGIGTGSNPLTNLQVNSDLNGVSAVSIGAPNSAGNTNVPFGASPGGYNIDFYTWRDMVPNQVGSRIRAERMNRYLANTALAQAMDLSFYTSDGWLAQNLTEKMRITSEGNIGIGTKEPRAKLDILGGIMMQSTLNNQSARPVISPTKIPGEIRVYSSAGATADDGLLRLSAGGGSSAGVLSYIDISSYSTVPDMDRNIVFGTNGSEKMRISTSGNVGIGMNSPAEKLSVNGNIRAKEIKVETQNWPDYVFKSDYSLPSLEATEQHIKEKGHLLGIPSAAEAEEQGINLSEMNGKLLKKIEELTLYLIEMNKELNKVKSDNKRFEEANKYK